MFRQRGPQEQVTPPQGGYLREQAQRKVQAALRGLESAATAEAESTPEPLVDQALERVRDVLGEVVVLDGSGCPVPLADVTRVVLGPLGARLRDADTAQALSEALQAPEQLPRHATPHTVGTGWPA